MGSSSDVAAVGASAQRLIFKPVGALARPGLRLYLTSTTLLFAELLLIRWIPANVIYVGFFRNFLLMANFLGIGLGILWGRDPRRVTLSPFGPLLLAIVLLVATGQISIQLRSPGEIFFGLSENKAADVNFVVLPTLVAIASLLMAGLAVPLGRLLTSMPPLRAYAIDITGSMTGVAAFTLVSSVGTPPIVWFALLGGLMAAGALGVGVTRTSLVTAATFGLTLLVILGMARPNQTWSPYYRIDSAVVGGIEELDVNGIPHQVLWPVTRSESNPIYNQVYRWFPQRTFGNVLIVGAGSGTDVALALAHGASHVDAVEIDPAIAQIGVERHPDHPFADPRVSLINDDGRSFLRQTGASYDLVVFALPDSLTLVSTSANLRLESFLFTREAFSEVRQHLAPDGVFVLYNYYRDAWLPQKIAGMLNEAFGSPPLVRLHDATTATLAAGPAVAALNGEPPPGDRADPVDLASAPRAATDDWPFLYLIEPYIAPYYLGALGLILAFAVLMVWRAAKRSGTGLRKFSPHFFFLGIAFLLLETRSLVTFSLLFGTTWIVNSFVFFAVLASVLAAIGVHSRWTIRRPAILYAILFASLGLAWLLPPASLLIDPPWLRYIVASALAFAPVFCANLVFSYSFRDTRTADMAFASNLLGSMVGGAVEYLALITGYQALLIVVAAAYALAWLAGTRLRLLADVYLVPDRDEPQAVAPAT